MKVAASEPLSLGESVRWSREARSRGSIDVNSLGFWIPRDINHGQVQESFGSTGY